MSMIPQLARNFFERVSRAILAAGILATFLAPIAQADTIDFLFGAGTFGRKASPIADCRNLFQRFRENSRAMRDTTWKNRTVQERAPQFLNDKEYLAELKYSTSTLGTVDSRFSKEFDTRFYYTSTAKPLADGTIPMVDPEAKALVVYFHGSGTAKASGSGFAGKCNSLAKMGYACLSFDLPFHSDGSRNPALADTEAFAKYVDSILAKVRNSGQPIILAGHSFGPDVIAEYITRYPRSVNAAVMISPGSFDDVTKKWFEEKTVYMKFANEAEANEAGGRWAGMVTRGNIWNKPEKRPDPTVVNPDLKVHVVSGSREEYVPGPLTATGNPTEDPRTYDVSSVYHRIFSKSDVRIEPGVGHYIFAHNDEEGQDVVLRSILKVDGHSLKNDEKALRAANSQRMQKRTSPELMAGRFSKEIFFRDWLEREAQRRFNISGQELTAKLLREEDKKLASSLMNEFGLIEKQRVEAMQENVKRTREWAPAFYEHNRAAIEKLGTKGNDPSAVFKAYLDLLEKQPDAVVSAHSMVGEDVLVPPVKPERDPAQQNFKKRRGDGDQRVSPDASKNFFVPAQWSYSWIWELAA